MPTSRFVSPPISQFDKLRQPLEPGEKLVFEFFDAHLPEDWEIYIQPHLNGLRPDFVILNPKVGIGVFEVKDWNLNAMDYRIEEQRNRPPKLIGTKDGKSFSLQSQNPIEKVQQYKQEIFDLYCPRLEQGSGFAAITAGVIFPFASEQQVRALFNKSMLYRDMIKYSHFYPVVGADSLQSGDLLRVFPEGKRYYSKYMNQDLYLDFKNWLIEPDFAAEQRKPLTLDKAQKSFVNSRTKNGYRRIRGAAGSGKSLVLAARAAELLAEGKTVLVVTYNITLLHYLMDVAVRWPSGEGKTRKDITWLNFHYWCKRVCMESGHEDDYKALWENSDEDDVLNIALPALVNRIIDTVPDEVTHYDAVLVDEGQDFMPNWWALLRRVCLDKGEMLLVADATQDIYDTAKSWTDEAMKGAGFSGAWAELETSYRLPQLAMDKVCEFATEFMPPELVNLPKSAQLGLAIEPCNLRWVQVNESNAIDVCCDELMRLAIENNFNEGLSITDSTFLCDSKKIGYEVIKKLGSKGVKTVHTFAHDDKESRRQKVGFYMSDARIKATTLHSFKGWESRALVIYVSNKTDQKTLALIYTGLTRLKRHEEGSCLTVVSCSEKLLKYGKKWPEFETKILHRAI
ncbi:DNA helicase [Alginatibacterium sediminis]|uniref:DNA helicase n=1 Tax=Alginatibacterium sediminis TaxID=2164068 RepID=A0A420EDU0_9ALTE|nr:AAA family ATPase [Alginatibacterium sediminis]RKF18836.1 DNA helicase [Alginatibacterium sediminis]